MFLWWIKIRVIYIYLSEKKKIDSKRKPYLGFPLCKYTIIVRIFNINQSFVWQKSRLSSNASFDLKQRDNDILFRMKEKKTRRGYVRTLCLDILNTYLIHQSLQRPFNSSNHHSLTHHSQIRHLSLSLFSPSSPLTLDTFWNDGFSQISQNL